MSTPEKIRTSNRLIRSQVLYPIELRVHLFFFGLLNFVPLFVPIRWELKEYRETRGQYLNTQLSIKKTTKIRNI